MKNNALIGQSGGPTSVINSSLAGVTEACIKKGLDVYGMLYGIEGFMKDELTDLGRQKKKVIANLRSTPSSALGSCRHKVKEEDFPQILRQLEKYSIRYFFLIGGNDTMDTIHRVEKYSREKGYEIFGIGIPKTVDNDLFGTDHTPGYASAARYTALSVQQAGRLACDMQRVDRFTVYQTVGRDAGWLAASAALAKKKDEDAPHIIYIPEIRLTREKIITDAKTVINKYGYAYIVCGEGILFDDGTPVSQSAEKDRFSNVEYGAMSGSSAAMAIHRIIKEATGFRGEFQITESLPMCAIDRAAAVDLKEAYECGRKAVQLALAGESGKMVSIKRLKNKPYKYSLQTVPLSEVAVHARPMPPDMFLPEKNTASKKFLEYLRPLTGELDEYSVLKKIPIKSTH
ncbi:MAG: phosphofructokinase [Spirochaetes bacterium GWF1_41_5]|nr:MAG: phosphofructokinase [Spirochaetes bacterium GWF1_41_5]HBE01500.1 phosphofructokinase [Spirochaetia bacterium]